MSKAYFSRDALSNSGIKEILKSPAHFKHWTENPKEDSSAFRVGRAFHMMVLEPHRMESELAIFREMKTFNSKAGEAFLAMHPNHNCVTLDEYNQAWNMASSLGRHETITNLLRGCRKEVEIYDQIRTEHGLIDRKVMLDAVNDKSVFDLKTTDESAADFEWTAKKYQYDVQAHWYIDAAEKDDFYFIVVEKKPPYGVLVYQASDLMIARGAEKNRRAAELYARCKALNEWPGYDTNVIRQLN